MGLFDIFRRKKDDKALPSSEVPQKSSTQAIPDGLSQYKINYEIQNPTAVPQHDVGEVADWIFVPGSTTVVLPEQDEQTGDIIIKLKREALSGKMVEIGTMLERVDKETFKYLVAAIDAELDRPRLKGGSNPNKLTQIRNVSKKEIEAIAKEKDVALSPDFYKIIENINSKTQLILNPDLQLDYRDFEKQIPQSVDVSQVPLDQLLQYGEVLATRLKTLKNITSPADTVKYESSLINFMKAQERDATPGAILAMLPEGEYETQESIIRRHTVLECAETAQKAVQSEDNLMYSAFLKLEERRILTQLQSDLEHLPADEATSARVHELVNMLETTKIHPQGQTSASLIRDEAMDNAVSGFMSEVLLENSVSSYLSQGLRKDLIVKAFISQHPEFEHSEEAAQFLTTRMRSSGQVVDIPKDDSLRDFIEHTDYKSDRDEESHKFLFSVARLEEEHLKKVYSPILQLYAKYVGRQDQQLQAEPAR